MKRLLLIILLIIAGSVQAQSWQTIRLNTTLGIYAPYDCFKLNPYTNDLWFCNNEMVASLSPTGERRFMDMTGVSDLPADHDLAFTPAYTYFADEIYGLFRINNDYSKTQVYNDIYVGKVFSNGDTIYMGLTNPNGYLSYTSNGIISSTIPFERIEAKRDIKYGAYNLNSSFMKYTGIGTSGYSYYSTIDNEHFCGQFHDAKFSRLTDTFYVSCTQGITKAINYDFNDSIVPSNTINMPSANVIEFEFDDQDRLWAVFGDANDVPFAFARLDGNEWTNRYDASNCPINFAAYKGLEIDTLGNLWVSESFYLHTLLTPNSPVWLGTQELALETLEAYPNPAEDQVTIKLPNVGGRLQVADLSGVVLLEEKVLTEQELSLDISSWMPGCYVATWTDGDRKQQVLIVK